MVGILRATVLVAALVFASLGSATFSLGEVGVVSPAVAAPADTTTVLTIDDHMGGWDDWGWGWLVMMPMMLIFWGGLIWLIVWLVRRTGGETGGRDNDPVEIARRRYARGEISGEELEQIRRNLIG